LARTITQTFENLETTATGVVLKTILDVENVVRKQADAAGLK
jgi:hypothetical protein